jgi:O-antigen/teichoic acid export membrane protein
MFFATPGLGLGRFALPATLWVICASADRIGSGVLLGFDRYRAFVGISCLNAVVTVPLFVLLLRLWGFDGAVFATVAIALLQATLVVSGCARAGRADSGISFGRFRSESHGLLSIAFPSGFSGWIVTPVQTIALNVVGGQPGGTAAVGLFAAASRFVNVAYFVPSTVALTLVPMLAAEWVGSVSARFRAALERAIGLLWMMAVPICVVMWVAGGAMLSLLFGEPYREAWPLLAVLMTQLVAAAINEANDRALLASGRSWLAASNTVLYVIAFVTLLVYLVPRGGIFGYVAAYLTAFVGYAALQGWWAHRLFGVRWRRFVPLLALTIAALSASVSLGAILPGMSAIPAAGMLALLTLALEWFAVLSTEERAVLVGRIRRRLSGHRQTD